MKGPMYIDSLFKTFAQMKFVDENTFQEVLLKFIRILSKMIDKHLNYDLNSAYIHLIQKHFRDELLEGNHEEIKESFEKLMEKYKRSSDQVFNLSNDCMSVLKFLKSDRVL